VLLIILSEEPTAYTVLSSAKQMSRRSVLEPVIISDQLFPESVDLWIE
jgi:hypothetical protein